MDLTFNDEQRALGDAVGALLAREATTARLREIEAGGGFDARLWERLSQIAGPDLCPGDDAHPAMSLLDLGVVAELCGRHLAAVPFIETVVTARAAARSAVAGAVDAVLAGRTTPALHPARPGEPQLVPAGAVADRVLALRDGDLVVCALPAGSAREPIANLATAPLAAVVPSDLDVLATVGAGPDAAHAHAAVVRDWKALTAMSLTGAAAGALDLAAEYARNRVQFDEVIGRYQAIAFPLSDAKASLDGARLLCLKAMWAVDERLPEAPALVAMAFAFAAETAASITERAVHTLGGYGLTVEYDAQLYQRRARGWALVAGDPSEGYVEAADLMFATGTTASGELQAAEVATR